MIIDIDSDTLFPDGLSDETISAIADVLYEIAMQWENKHYHPLKRFDKARQVDLFDPLEPWHRQNPG